MQIKGLVPFIDLAYFGLGRGMEEDTYGLRKVVELCPEVIIAASCSKNFALYKERVGLIAIVCKDDATAAICLLYTSPSPRDQRGSRMPSSA